MRPWLIGLGAATVLLTGTLVTVPLAGADHERSRTPVAATPIIGSLLLQPTIDLVEAQKIALKGQGGAQVVEIDLNSTDGALVYRIALDTGIDVGVDATTGDIVGTQRDAHPDDVTATRQGKDDHDGDRRSARRDNRHHDDDDRPDGRRHRDRDDDVSVAPAGHPIQASGDQPQSRVVHERGKPTQSSRDGCTRHEPASLCPCPNRDED